MHGQSLTLERGQIWWRKVILWLIRMLEFFTRIGSLSVSFQVFVIKNALLTLGRSGRSKARMRVVSLHDALHELLV